MTTDVAGRGVYRRVLNIRGADGREFVNEYRRANGPGEPLRIEFRAADVWRTWQQEWMPAGMGDTSREVSDFLRFLRSDGGAAVADALLAEQRLADLCHRLGWREDSPWRAVADCLMDSDDPADRADGFWVRDTFGG